MHRTQRRLLTSGCSTYSQVRLRAPRGPAGAPSVVRCERHGPQILGAATTAMSSIAEERQRRRGGHAAATLRADGGRGRSLRCSSSTMLGHRLPPRTLTSAREPHRRAALGAPAGPLGRKPHWARHLADHATKAGEICGLTGKLRRFLGANYDDMAYDRAPNARQINSLGREPQEPKASFPAALEGRQIATAA